MPVSRSRSATISSTPRPWDTALSATTFPSALELLKTATPAPLGSGWADTICATSMSCSMVSTRITPAWRIMASRAPAGACVVRTAWPGGSCSPMDLDLATMTGLMRASRRAMPGELARVADRLQVQAHGGGVGVVLPELHHVVAGDIGPVSGREEGGDAERGAGWTRHSSATPIAADWLKSPSPPRRARLGAIEAFSDTAGWVFIMPSDAGPMTRMPLARACRTSSRCRTRPRSPSSANPAEATTIPFTPAAAHSSTTLGTSS